MGKPFLKKRFSHTLSKKHSHKKKDSFCYPFLIFLVVFDVFDVCKGFSFSALGEHGQPALQEVGGGGVHLFARVATLKIAQGVGVGIVLALVDFACCHAVAKHLLDVAHGHFDGFIQLCFGVDVVPILKMVAVAPFVVHPCIGAAEKLTLALVGAAVALIVARAREKFGGRIFREVVKKPLPANACAKTVRNDAMAVACDGGKMQKRVGHCGSPLSFVCYIIPHFCGKVKKKRTDV